MIPAFSTTFEDVSRDLGSADNQSVERTYRIVAYNSTTWMNEIPMHAHVFLLPVSKGGVGMHGPQTDAYYAFTPTQANDYLHKKCLEAWERDAVFTPADAAKELKYVGINMTPPIVEAKTTKRGPQERYIVVHSRSAMKMENHWHDARGTDFLSFAFKFVLTSEIKSFAIGLNEVRIPSHILTKGKDASKPMPFCVQIVAIRSRERVLPTKALVSMPGDVAKGAPLGMGVHIPVGIMMRNVFAPTTERNDEQWSVYGVCCHDNVKSAREHVDALTLVA